MQLVPLYFIKMDVFGSVGTGVRGMGTLVATQIVLVYLKWRDSIRRREIDELRAEVRELHAMVSASIAE